MTDSSCVSPPISVHQFGLLSPDSADDFIAIRNFMIAEGGLNLNSTIAPVYALIYSFSVDNQGVFAGSIAYIQSRTHLSKSSVIRSLKSLLEDGLIIEVGEYKRGNNRDSRCYRANIAVADKAKRTFREHWGKLQKQTRLSAGVLPSSVNLTPEGKIDHNNGFPQCSSPAITLTENVDNTPQIASSVSLTPEGSAAHVENPSFECQPDTRSGVSLTPYKKEPKKDSIHQTNQNSLSESVTHERMDGEFFDEEKFRALQDSCVNRNLISQSQAAYLKLLGLGFDAEIIYQAWQNKQAACKAQGRDGKYYPQLKRWLESTASDGAAAECQLLSQRIANQEKSDRTQLYQKLRLHHPEFEALISSVLQQQYELEIMGEGSQAELKKSWQAVEELAQKLEGSAA